MTNLFKIFAIGLTLVGSPACTETAQSDDKWVEPGLYLHPLHGEARVAFIVFPPQENAVGGCRKSGQQLVRALSFLNSLDKTEIAEGWKSATYFNPDTGGELLAPILVSKGFALETDSEVSPSEYWCSPNPPSIGEANAGLQGYCNQGAMQNYFKDTGLPEVCDPEMLSGSPYSSID